MIRRFGLSALVLMGMLSALGRAADPPAEKIAAPAALPVLKAIPDNALAVVLVNNLTQADAQLVRLGQQAGLPSTSALTMIKTILGITEGLDEKGTLAFVVQPNEGGPPAAPLIYIPVTDYAKFIAPLSPDKTDGSPTRILIYNEAALVAKKGNYAVVTAPPFEEALKAAVAADRNIAAQLAPLSGWIGEHDASAIATTAGIKLVVATARQGMQQAKASIPAGIPNAQQITAIFDIYDTVFKAADEEMTVAAAGLRIDKDSNVHLTSTWRFKADGPVAKALAAVPALAGKPFADLTAGPYLLAVDGVMPQGWLSGLWSSDFMKLALQRSGITDEQFGKIAEMSKESTRAVRGMALKVGVPAADEAALQNVVITMRVENAAKYMEALYKQIDQMQEISKGADSPLFKGYEFKKLDIDGAKAVEITADLAANSPPQVRQMVLQIYEKIFGPGGKMAVTYLPIDEHTIFATYTNSEMAAKKLAAIKSRQGGLAADPQVVKTLALLPANAQWQGVWDLAGTKDFIKQVMLATAGGRQPPPLPDVPATSPLGFAARASAEGFSTDVVIPADAVKVLGQLVPQLMQGGGSPLFAPPPLQKF